MSLVLDTAVLGDTRGTYPIHSLDDFHASLYAITPQAQRTIKVFADTLEHEVYSLPRWAEQLSDAIAARQRLALRLLVRRPSGLRFKGHRLVELFQRLPSYVAIHQCPDEALQDREEYLLFDDRGIIKRYPRADIKGFCEFASRDATVKARYFDSLWEKSTPCHELQTVHV